MVVLLSFACTLELLQIQIVDGEYYKEQTQNTYTANQTIQAARGQIFTSDGKLKTVVMMFNHKHDKTIASNLGKYFSDRYLPLSISGYDSYFINNNKDKADVAIVVDLFVPGYDGWGQITYMPYN